MSYQQAIAELDAQYAAGDMTADQYEVERKSIEYAHGEAMSAQDSEEVAA